MKAWLHRNIFLFPWNQERIIWLLQLTKKKDWLETVVLWELWNLALLFFSINSYSFKIIIQIVCICFLNFIHFRLMYDLPYMNLKFIDPKNCEVHVFCGFLLILMWRHILTLNQREYPYRILQINEWLRKNFPQESTRWTFFLAFLDTLRF